MNAPREWLLPERLAELALATLLLEALVFFVRARRNRHGPPLRALVIMLIPGACLLLALRAAAAGLGELSVAGWLTAALIAHIADLRERLRRPASDP